MGLVSFLGGSAYGEFRSKLNTITLVTAFILSIMVIHNTRTCENKKGYPPDHTFVNFGYGVSIFILIAICIIFALDLFFKATRFTPI
jgi:hypothetical protein